MAYATFSTFSLTSNPTSFNVVKEFSVVATWKTTNFNCIKIETSPSILFQTIGAFYSSLSVLSKKVKLVVSPKNALTPKKQGFELIQNLLHH